METSAIRPRRSLIFFPGNKPELFEKALATGADIITADLEDAIAPADKELARTETFKLFAKLEAGEQECMVRINSIRSADGLAKLCRKQIATASTPASASSADKRATKSPSSGVCVLPS